MEPLADAFEVASDGSAKDIYGRSGEGRIDATSQPDFPLVDENRDKINHGPGRMGDYEVKVSLTIAWKCLTPR